MTGETILPAGAGHRFLLAIEHGNVVLALQSHRREEWIRRTSLIIAPALVHSVAATLARLAGELEQGLTP